MFQARRAKQVTTWRSTALLRAICLRGRTAERLAFHCLISTIEKVQKLPFPQSFQGQVALLQETKIWLVGKHFIKYKDVHTCFPVKMLKLDSLRLVEMKSSLISAYRL